jgi:hypothetical protein
MESTIERSEAHRTWVREYRRKNQTLRCKIWECPKHREGLSRFCTTHSNRAGLMGSPTFKPIDQLTGIAALSKQLAETIKAKELPDLENRLIANIIKGLPRDQSYIYRNREIESGLKTLEKARIILATATPIAGPEQVVAFAILWAIANELDGPLHSNKAQQKAFFRTHLGNDISTLADIGRKWTETKKTYRLDSWHFVGQKPVPRLASEERVPMRKKQMIRGATKRKAGQIVLDAVLNQLGRTSTWIDDPWAAPYAEHIRERLASVPFHMREYALENQRK